MTTVSRQTGNFIECMKAMQDLYTKVYKSLHEMYSAEVTESIISDGFIAEFAALERRIEQFVLMSMKDNLSNTGTDEI